MLWWNVHFSMGFKMENYKSIFSEKTMTQGFPYLVKICVESDFSLFKYFIKNSKSLTISHHNKIVCEEKNQSSISKNLDKNPDHSKAISLFQSFEMGAFKTNS